MTLRDRFYVWRTERLWDLHRWIQLRRLKRIMKKAIRKARKEDKK